MSRAPGRGVDWRLFSLWESLRTSLWAVPSGLAIAALLAARGALAIDAHAEFGATLFDRWLYSGSVEGARTILSAVAGSMITVAGLVFSITIVALSTATTQLGPRLLQSFRGDRVNQVVLGCFVATFLYNMTALSSLRGSESSVFVPRLAITGGLVLSTLSFGVLIYFVHHVAELMQAEEAIQRVRASLEAQIGRLYTGRSAPDLPDAEGAPDKARYVVRAHSVRSGYIQGIDYDHLARVADEQDVDVLCTSRPGDFVLAGAQIARLTGPLEDDHTLCEAFVVGSRRTDAEDPLFGLHQLVEIALRALSPGINDPYTAVACLDHLAAALVQLAECQTPLWVRRGESSRVWARTVTFDEAFDITWNRVRQYGARQTVIAQRMLELLHDLGTIEGCSGRRHAFQEHAHWVRDEYALGDATEVDRAIVSQRFARVLDPDAPEATTPRIQR